MLHATPAFQVVTPRILNQNTSHRVSGSAVQAVQFLVDDGGQPLKRALVAVAPGSQQRAYIAHSRLALLCCDPHCVSLNYTARPLF